MTTKHLSPAYLDRTSALRRYEALAATDTEDAPLPSSVWAAMETRLDRLASMSLGGRREQLRARQDDARARQRRTEARERLAVAQLRAILWTASEVTR